MAKTKNKTNQFKIFISAMGILGALFMVYLAKLHFEDAGQSFCDITEGVSCSLVNTSAFSDIFGVPVSLLGLFYFITIIVVPFIDKIKKKNLLIAGFTVFSLVFSLYLSFIEFFVLHSICLFCESSKVVMLAILTVSLLDLKQKKEKLNVNVIAVALVVGLLFSLIAYFIQSSPRSIEDYTDVAKCLTQKGVTMYGTYWCPRCAKQRELFGEAVQFVHEIECDPRGENSEAELCIEKNIVHTPTWIQEKDNEEVKRVEGFYKLDDLAAMFGCPHQKETE